MHSITEEDAFGSIGHSLPNYAASSFSAGDPYAMKPKQKAEEFDSALMSPDLRKTRICMQWKHGTCNETNCCFAHGRQELRATHDCFKTKLCAFYLRGNCKSGSRCRHAHGEDELRPAEFPLTHTQKSAVLAWKDEGVAPKDCVNRLISQIIPELRSRDPVAVAEALERSVQGSLLESEEKVDWRWKREDASGWSARKGAPVATSPITPYMPPPMLYSPFSPNYPPFPTYTPMYTHNPSWLYDGKNSQASSKELITEFADMSKQVSALITSNENSPNNGSVALSRRLSQLSLSEQNLPPE
eukprot:Platyproteum_vivax@DN4645_c0_g1_i2.p1